MNPAAPVFVASALSRGIAAHVVASSIAGLAVLVIIVACRRAPAGLRRTLAWMGLAKFALPAAVFAPLVGLVGRLAGRSPGARAADLPLWRHLVTGGLAGPAWPAALVYGLLGAWGIVTLALLARSAARSSAFRRSVLEGAGPASRGLQRGVEGAAARVGLDPATLAVVPSDSEGPGILGFRSPLLVIPRKLEASLTPAEFEAILVHELVHLRNRDHVWGSIRTFLLSVFWYDPVVWLLCRTIAMETEKACDEEVVRLTGKPGAYADGILKTVRLSLGLLDGRLTGAAGHSVASRLRSILSPQPTIDSRIMKTLALCAASLVAFVSVYADASADSASAPGPRAQAADTYDISKLDVYPKVLSQVRPVYPPDLHSKGVAGEVLVDFVVDTGGSVKNAFVARSSNREFEKSALDSVNQWTFTPGQVAGKTVNTHMQVPIVYTVNADGPAPKS